MFKKITRGLTNYIGKKADTASDSFNKLKIMASHSYSDKIPDGYKLDSELSNRREKVYHDDNGNAVVSYRGTTLNKKDALRDLGADALLMLGLQDKSSRFKKGVDVANKAKEKYNNVELTGHSLGGSIANYVSSKTGLSGNAYNSGLGLGSIGKKSYMNDSKINNYNTLTDPISAGNIMASKLGLNKSKSEIWTGKKGHGIDSR